MSRINLSDDADMIMQKVKKAKTDPEPIPSEAAGLAERPEARNLVDIYAAIAGEDVAQVLARFGGQGFGAFKPALGDLLVSHLAPIAERFRALKDDHAAIDAILIDGAARASALGKPTLEATYCALGLAR
jgi:tryptophanyl-tRNA synthetase